MMVDMRKPIMFVGGAGVGKTQLVKGKLGVLPEEIISLAISFNYFTGEARKHLCSAGFEGLLSPYCIGFESSLSP